MSLAYVCLAPGCDAFHQPPRDLRGHAMYHAGGAGYAYRASEVTRRPAGCTDGTFPESSWDWDGDQDECVACVRDRVAKVDLIYVSTPQVAVCRADWLAFLEHCAEHGAGMRPT